MKFIQFVVSLAVVAAAASSQASRVYVISCGSGTVDADVAVKLAQYGHQVTVGGDISTFDGTQNLLNYDVVYLQESYSYVGSDMPTSGQSALVAFVNNGGGLVTSEWTLWSMAAQGRMPTLNSLMPSEPTSNFNGLPNQVFAKGVADPVINAGLPDQFTLPGDNVGGAETNISQTRPLAKVFYNSIALGQFFGVVGWDQGQGRVINFSTINTNNFIADPTGSRLLSNTINWVGHGANSFLINVTSFSIKFGKLSAGDSSSLTVIDGSPLRVCNFLVPNQQVAPVTVELDGTSPTASPVKLTFQTISRVTVSGPLTITLDLFDWTTNSFSSTAVTTTPVGTGYSSALVGGDGNIARFIGSGNKVRARYRIRAVGPTSNASWCNEMDQAVWYVR